MVDKKIFLYLALAFKMTVFAQPLVSVTYETTSGRFGDNLLSYLHAKWVSYSYNIPLVYKPFIYSDQMTFSDKYPKQSRKQRVLECDNLEIIKSTFHRKPILYVIPYFPESKYELEHGISFKGGKWNHFPINWKDPIFINEVFEDIKPKTSPTLLPLPKDKITIALHIRKGGNYDSIDVQTQFVLKFLPTCFFIESLERISLLFKNQSLYVFLFTDDNNPNELLEIYKNHFSSYDIEFECRATNSENINVLEDFFSILQFDCLIHSESNFSMVPSLIGDYMVSIYPDSFRIENGIVFYDNVVTKINENKIRACIHP